MGWLKKVYDWWREAKYWQVVAIALIVELLGIYGMLLLFGSKVSDEAKIYAAIAVIAVSMQLVPVLHGRVTEKTVVLFRNWFVLLMIVGVVWIATLLLMMVEDWI